jgi:hypothetical protein
MHCQQVENKRGIVWLTGRTRTQIANVITQAAGRWEELERKSEIWMGCGRIEEGVGVIYEWQGTAGTAMDPSAVEVIRVLLGLGEGNRDQLAQGRQQEPYVWLLEPRRVASFGNSESQSTPEQQARGHGRMG